MRPLAGLAAALLTACGGAETAEKPAERSHCQAVTFDAAPFIVCTFARDADVRLRLYAKDGAPLGNFDSLASDLGGDPVMAMNAGMYHPDRRPVGLYIEGAEQTAPLLTGGSPGNFGMLPNGVFWSNGSRVFVTETLAFDVLEAEPDFATQSGPMLVIDGALHPKFNLESESRRRRNGVGVSDAALFFAISDAPVNFHHFARLFRDELGADNALYLDGAISMIRAPELYRSERGVELGPMVAVMPNAEPDASEDKLGKDSRAGD